MFAGLESGTSSAHTSSADSGCAQVRSTCCSLTRLRNSQSALRGGGGHEPKPYAQDLGFRISSSALKTPERRRAGMACAPPKHSAA